MSISATTVKHYRCYLDGRWVESDASIEVQNPATGEVFATVPACSSSQAEQALASSEQAQLKWQALPAHDRAMHLYAIIDRLKAEQSLFAELLVKEQGKTLAEAGGEVADTIRYLQYSAEAARRLEGSIFLQINPTNSCGSKKFRSA